MYNKLAQLSLSLSVSLSLSLSRSLSPSIFSPSLMFFLVFHVLSLQAANPAFPDTSHGLAAYPPSQEALSLEPAEKCGQKWQKKKFLMLSENGKNVVSGQKNVKKVFFLKTSFTMYFQYLTSTI